MWLLLVFCTGGGGFAESIFSDFGQQIKESDKIISAGLMIPYYNHNMDLGSDYGSFDYDKVGFGFDGQFRMVLPKNLAFMADMDIAIFDVDDDYLTASFSIVLGAGYNFNFGNPKLKLIASGFIGFEGLQDVTEELAHWTENSEQHYKDLTVEAYNFIFGANVYANYRFTKRFGIFAQCDLAFGVGGCSGDIDEYHYRNNANAVATFLGDDKETDKTDSVSGRSSTVFMFKPKFGVCWTL